MKLFAWLHPLDRKLWRDLGGMKGQVLTIALVVAAGVAAFVTTRSAHASLVGARDAFYADRQFADVFARLRRAPLTLRERLESIEGVALVDPRIVEQGSVPLEDVAEPASATAVSLPLALNRVHLRSGRMPAPGARDEAVLSDAFAVARKIELGDTIPLVLGGVQRRVRVVGIGISPEYVLLMAPGQLAMDPGRQCVLFMERAALEAPLHLEGAFSDVSFRLQPDARPAEVIDRIDALLEPYGGFGAIEREDQVSHDMLSQELGQLGNMSTQVPPLFLMVAALLLHVVLSRIVQLQRGQIATLKALGYRNREIGLFYAKLASVVVGLGAALGLLLGAWLASAMVGLYEEFFRFPTLQARVDVRTAVIAVVVSVSAGCVGTFTAVRKVLALPPAEAMRPPAPDTYRRGLLDAAWLRRWVGGTARMVAREIQRRPLRVLLSALGISIAVGILVVGRYFGDAMNWMVDVHLHETQRWDVQVAFRQPRSAASLSALRALPGVERVEPLRSVPVTVRHGRTERSIAVTGYAGDGSESLQRVVAEDGGAFVLPPGGAVLTRTLGEVLGARVGDVLEFELHEGARGTREVRVAGFVAEPFGLQAHMRADALRALLREEPVASAALLTVERPAEVEALDRRLVAMPDVIGVTHRARVIQTFRDQTAQNIGAFSLILTLFAMTIVVGVVYNNARVALSTRERDLASLRVLGFTKGEIGAILLGELAVQVLLAIPIGLALGHVFAQAMAGGADPELFRLPSAVRPATYAFAATVTMAGALASALLVRRKLGKLDLIAVLKTRE